MSASTELAPPVITPLVNATRFRAAHEEDWDRLDYLITRIEKRSVGALSDDDLLALPLLYRTALSSLSVVRETSLDRALASYLEQLCTRAYFQLYGVPTSFPRQLARFFASGWPLSVQALWKETLFCALLMVIAAVTGFMLVAHDPSWYYAIVPDGMSQGRDPSASTQLLRDTIYNNKDKNFLTTFAMFLFTHNSQVAIFAFALGFAFAVPTLLLVIYTGLSAGAMLAVFASKGLAVGFAGWLTIHGTTELFAITIASAAGVRIGTAVALPGNESRVDSAMRAGRSTGMAVAGVVCMLLVAGLLEGIGRQTVETDFWRVAIGSTALLGWLCYFYLPRRGGRDASAAR